MIKDLCKVIMCMEYTEEGSDYCIKHFQAERRLFPKFKPGDRAYFAGSSGSDTVTKVIWTSASIQYKLAFTPGKFSETEFK